METQKMRTFRWFWPWQDDREEAWLAEMSREGWHLVAMSAPALYRFTRGEPRPYVYRLDWQGPSQQELSAYLQLFQDAGWEHVLMYSGWHYFRKEATPGEQPEIYTDVGSKLAKYQRVLTYLVSTPAFSLLALVLLMDYRPSPAASVFIGLLVLLVLIELYMLAGMWGRVRQLKKQRAISF